MIIDSEIIWSVIGICLIIFETFAISTVYLFFVGIGAVLVALFLHFSIIADDNILMQLGVCSIVAAISAYIIYTKKNNSTKDVGQYYSNIIGSDAIILEQDIITGIIGKAKWSGTTMNAKISKHSKLEKLEKNQSYEIVDLEGNILILMERKK